MVFFSFLESDGDDVLLHDSERVSEHLKTLRLHGEVMVSPVEDLLNHALRLQRSHHQPHVQIRHLSVLVLEVVEVLRLDSYLFHH